MTRIVVMGQPGAGKSTLARRLSTRLGVAHVELDAFQHLSGWVANRRLHDDVADALDVAADGWVVDGNYLALRDTVLARADTVIWLDYPCSLTTWRVTRRTVRRLVTRQVLWNGNRERLRNLFDADHPIWWSCRTATRHRRTYPQAYAQFAQLEVHRVRRPRDLPAIEAALR